MLRRSGQAAGWILHLAGEIVLGLALVVLVAAGALAWRLAEGPIDLSFLVPRLSAALTGRPGGTHIQIGAASLAWEGFRRGIESPLDLVLADTTLTNRDGSGRLTIPRAELALSVPALLVGRVVPREIVIEAPRLHAVVGEGGGVALSFGGGRTETTPSAGTARLAGALLDALTARPGNDQSASAAPFPALRELTNVTIRDADVTVVDQKLDATWFARAAQITLMRGAEGGLTGRVHMALSLKDRPAVLSVAVHLEADQSLKIMAHLAAVRPAELARLAPELGPLSAVDAPVSFGLDLVFGPSFRLQNALLTADAGAGKIAFGGGSVPIEGGVVKIASAGEDVLAIREAVLNLDGPHGKAGPVLRADGSALQDPDGTWRGELAFAVDRVPMADLGRYWPPAIARGGRQWVTENITGGYAERARAAVRFTFTRRDRALTVESAYGEVPGSGLVVHWLRPIAPMTDGSATLSMTGPDALTIAVAHARQGPLEVAGGSVRITGLEKKHQDAAITARISGPLSNVLALLAEPRLRLLSRHPLPVANIDGQSDTTVSIALPLLKNVTMDQVAVHAKSTLTAVGAHDIAAGLSLAGGRFSLNADNDGMALAGSGGLGGVPIRLDYTMNFRAGPETQVVQRLTADTTITAAQLAEHGLVDATELIDGPVALSAELDVARDGAARMRLGAGLTKARLSIASLGFVKRAGDAATARAEIALAGKRIAAVDAFSLTGAGISVIGTASFAGGKPSFVRIDHAEIGASEASGSVRFALDGQPMAIVVQGPVLDLRGRFIRRTRPTGRAGAARKQEAKSSPWTLDARFGRVLLAHGRVLTDCVLSARSDGTMITEAKLGGSLGKGETVSLSLGQATMGRTLSIASTNAGDLLAALGVTTRIDGGRLTLAAHYERSQAGHPLAGTAKISDFRVKNAPALGKVLQAMTLYGLADAVAGPGLGFSDLVAPFTFSDDLLTLNGARAFSASLGLTADGTIDLAHETTRLTGTVVPAYFFNSLLGRIPLIGRIFSPEKGSGLFAATYSVTGPLADPSVTINPLAAITPGFLRDIFRIFD
ncbi:MAG: AsmA-like C-terminal region-containing protein [Acetobacteraceae bacterium]